MKLSHFSSKTSAWSKESSHNSSWSMVTGETAGGERRADAREGLCKLL
jgi:hypothetical protein